MTEYDVKEKQRQADIQLSKDWMNRPATPELYDLLDRAMQRAVREEEYERAAIFRDAKAAIQPRIKVPFVRMVVRH